MITAALFTRFRTRQARTFGEKMPSTLRFGFGGHVEGQEPRQGAMRPVIEAIADALARDGELDGAQIDALIAEMVG